MSQENVKTLRRLYGFFRSRDYGVIEDAVESDAVIDVSRNVFNPGVHEGLDGLRVFLAQIDEMWTGFGRESGVKTEMCLFVVVKFHNGKIARFTGGFRDRDEALEAAGISG